MSASAAVGVVRGAWRAVVGADGGVKAGVRRGCSGGVSGVAEERRHASRDSSSPRLPDHLHKV